MKEYRLTSIKKLLKGAAYEVTMENIKSGVKKVVTYKNTAKSYIMWELKNEWNCEV